MLVRRVAVISLHHKNIFMLVSDKYDYVYSVIMLML